jgi:hypothetical protein
MRKLCELRGVAVSVCRRGSGTLLLKHRLGDPQPLLSFIAVQTHLLKATTQAVQVGVACSERRSERRGKLCGHSVQFSSHVCLALSRCAQLNLQS